MRKAFGRGFDSRRLHHKFIFSYPFLSVVGLLLFVLLAQAQDPYLNVFEGSKKTQIPLQSIEGNSYIKVTDLQPHFAIYISPIAGNQSLSLTIGQHNVILSANRSLVSLDGKLVSLQSPVYVAQGDWFVPLDFIARVLKATTDKHLLWLESTRSLILGDVVPNQVLLKYSMESDHSRIVLQSTRPVSYGTQMQGGALVITPHGEDFSIGFQETSFTDGILKSLAFSGKSIRIETDQGYGTFKSFELSDPPRLVVDFFRKPQTETATPPAPAPAPPVLLPEPGAGKGVIVIDPGHGGTETGAAGPQGTLEKDITLSIARKLRSVLENNSGTRVILTREGDQLVPLDDRTALANNNKADLFISIHLNSTLRGYGKGAETYFLSTQATDDQARNSAAVENNAVGVNQAATQVGSDLKLILWDMAQTEYLTESSHLAETIQQELNDTLGIANRGIKQAPFRVLMGATMPAVLVEVGFINNPAEEKLMNDADYQMKIARAIFRSVQKFQNNLAAAPALPSP